MPHIVHTAAAAASLAGHARPSSHPGCVVVSPRTHVHVARWLVTSARGCTCSQLVRSRVVVSHDAQVSIVVGTGCCFCVASTRTPGTRSASVPLLRRKLAADVAWSVSRYKYAPGAREAHAWARASAHGNTPAAAMRCETGHAARHDGRDSRAAKRERGVAQARACSAAEEGDGCALQHLGAYAHMLPCLETVMRD